MKKFLLFTTVILFSLTVFSQKISYTYNFQEPVIKNVGNFQLLVFPNSKQVAPIGEPSIPFVSAKLMLPPGMSAHNVTFKFEQKQKIKGKFHLYPGQNVHPVSKKTTSAFDYNKEIYSTEKYPDIKYSDVSTEFMNGYGFAFSKFTPIEYNPSNGEVYFYKKITISIDYKKTNKAQQTQSFLSSRKKIKQRAKSLADNPDMIIKYPDKKSSTSYDMLIITDNNYINDFDDLINFHLYRGIEAQIISIADIENQMTGQDTQEKMRNYIIQEYQNNDIEYVILGGDANVVPYRGMYCEVESSSTYTDDNIPADIYFSALDGTWNDDGDNYWGEEDEDDLLPEVAVGRLPFSNSTELASIINKIISYSNNPVTSTNELENPLLAGEHLYDDPQTWGADYLELLVGYHNDNGYETTGIPEGSTYTTMYQRDGNNWGGSDIINQMNQGHSFVHHVGHANSSYMMGLYNSDITNSNFSQLNGTDHNYTLVYSHGCICGAFDEEDCISELMVTIDNCAVGVFTNSRYGWFNEGQTEGPSQHLHREFIDALYHDKQNNAGVAELISKHETAPWVENPDEWEPGAQRWVFYDHNVLTDPALPIWTSNPFDFQTSYDDVLYIGADYNVSLSSNKAPMEGYNCAIIQNSQVIGKAVTNSSGVANISVDLDKVQLGSATLIVAGYNIIAQQYDITIEEPTTAVLTLTSSAYIDDNNNKPDYNETVGLNLTIKNIGIEDATNVTLTISSDDDEINILNNTDNLGTIPALDSSTSNNTLELSIGSVADQYSTDINLNITSDQYNTDKTIPLTVNAPKLEYLSIDITEISGDGDGVVEPDEIGNFSFNFINSGHAISPDITGLLESDDSKIDIYTSSVNIGEIDTNENFSISSNFYLNSSAQIGDIISINAKAKAPPYSKVVDFSFYVGDPTEDFETGDFSKFDWNFSGDANWITTNSNVYQGNYSAVNSDIDDSQSASLKITVDILTDGEISFYKKVSSEEFYDFLNFYIDGSEQDSWSGEVNWSQQTYNISAGEHTFKWTYEKDIYVSNGSDCAWLDNIVFPPFGEINVYTNIQNQNSHKSDISVYPVPFDNYVNFEFSAQANKNYRIEIYDISGKNIFTYIGLTNYGKNNFIWKPNYELNNGIYLYRVIIDKKIINGKIIKK